MPLPRKYDLHSCRSYFLAEISESNRDRDSLLTHDLGSIVRSRAKELSLSSFEHDADYTLVFLVPLPNKIDLIFEIYFVS